jgi:cation-transporting ATPase 13A3/4/5
MKKTALEFMREEVTTFFYFYQLMMFAVWLSFGSIFVSVIPMLLVLAGAIASVYLQYQGQEVIMKLTTYQTDVQVRRDGSVRTISSYDVVPGDTILLSKSDWIMPCDAVLIRGGCIMNESSLTGESMPVQKKACDNDTSVMFSIDGGRFANHVLYAGTTVLEQRLTGDSTQDKGDASLYSEAFVIRTGVSTSKGQLVSSILHPEKIRFKFEDELEAVVLLLSGLALISFVIGVAFVVSNGSKALWTSTWVSAIFTASDVLSPLLPVALKVGQIRSTERLQKVGINCLSPRHISICGKIKIFCFDKTGTLTKEGMEFCGAIPQINAKLDVLLPASSLSAAGSDKRKSGAWHSAQTDIEADASENPMTREGSRSELDASIAQLVTERIAVCHEVALHASKMFIGNEIDVKMFTATGWTLRNDSQGQQQKSTVVVTSADGKTSYRILRQFSFDHAKQTMTVIVESVLTGQRFVVTKGSYEKMESICTSESIPSDYHMVSSENAFQGGYVLGIAHRPLTEEECPREGGIAAIEALQRDALESSKSQQFLALLIFRNEPKPESRDVLLHLRSGGVRPVMITGDNARCGQYVARSCGMIDERSHILIGAMDPSKREVHWEFLQGEASDVTTFAERPTRVSEHRAETTRSTLAGSVTSLSTANLLKRLHHTGLHAEDGNRVELAITGNDVLEKLISSNHLVAMLPHIRIFARMSPESKTTIIRTFRSVGYTVGMCGDGGNDCGALKAAHAGNSIDYVI